MEMRSSVAGARLGFSDPPLSFVAEQLFGTQTWNLCLCSLLFSHTSVFLPRLVHCSGHTLPWLHVCLATLSSSIIMTHLSKRCIFSSGPWLFLRVGK